MAKVIYAPAAENDLLGIAGFIAQDKPGAARITDAGLKHPNATLVTLDIFGRPSAEDGLLPAAYRSRSPKINSTSPTGEPTRRAISVAS
jgi:plasmid stabilization system protein ParE